MRKAMIILALLLPLVTVAAPKASLRVGTYELGNSFNRRVQAEKGKISSQRMWCHCADAIAEAILDADCDILGIHDVCDTIAGRREGTKSIIRLLQEKGGDIDGLILSNVNPNFPLEGPMANGNGILWRASRFELRDWGINWLGGIYDKPGRDKSLRYGGDKVSMMWVRLFDKAAGKEIVFASADVNGPTQYDHGEKVVYHEINAANCRNIISLMKSDIVPRGMTSVITLNSRNAPQHDGFKELNSSVWLDAYSQLRDEGALDEAAADGKDTPDRIFVSGASILSYAVLKKKYPTADGTLLFPAQRFPVISELQY